MCDKMTIVPLFSILKLKQILKGIYVSKQYHFLHEVSQQADYIQLFVNMYQSDWAYKKQVSPDILLPTVGEDQ